MGIGRTVDPVKDQSGESAVSSVRISGSSGRVRVIAEPRGDVVVSGEAAIHDDGGSVTVEAGSNRIEVHVPEHVDVVVGTTSGRVDVEGALGSVAVVCESGRVTIDRADSLDVRTSSGRVDVDHVTGRTRVRTDSGAVTVRATGEAEATTDAGRIVLGSVSGPAKAHCVSGRITIGLAEAADVEAETVSGRISITIPAGVTVRRLTGSLPARPARDECDCTIATRSGGGRVAVKHR